MYLSLVRPSRLAKIAEAETTNTVWWQSAAHRRIGNSTAALFVTMIGHSTSPPSSGAVTASLTVVRHCA